MLVGCLFYFNNNKNAGGIVNMEYADGGAVC